MESTSGFQLVLLFFILQFNLCHAQKDGTMEKMDVNKFENNSSGGSFEFKLDDKTEVKQYKFADGYVEKMYPPNKLNYIYKEFYNNGRLKKTGQNFIKGDFPVGIWMEYDSTGIKIQEINYDTPYHLSIEDIFNYIKDKKIPFLMDNKYSTINRGLLDSNYVWTIEWQASDDELISITLNDKTGEVIDRIETQILHN